jgi:simple sugar transport system permease protein
MNFLKAFLETFTNPIFYKVTLSASTPLLFAALGGLFSEKTGVTNIALEGIMLLGAFSGVAGTYIFGSPWIGLILAIIVGISTAALHAWASINFQADQIVSATAIILLAQGVTGFLLEPVFGKPGSTPIIEKIPEVHLSFLGEGTFLYKMIGSFSPFVYLALIMVIVSWFIIYKTKLGLRMRAVGENPEAADTLGVSVFKVRWFGVLMSGLLASLGGAYLSIGELGQFSENMTNGKGFIALAAMILGNWSPKGTLLACLLFGAAEALNEQLQSNPALAIPSSVKPLFNLIPFVITLVVVAGFVGKTRGPAASGTPYEKKG